MTARSDWRFLPGSARTSAQHVLVLISVEICSQLFSIGYFFLTALYDLSKILYNGVALLFIIDGFPKCHGKSYLPPISSEEKFWLPRCQEKGLKNVILITSKTEQTIVLWWPYSYTAVHVIFWSHVYFYDIIILCRRWTLAKCCNI